MTYPAAFNASFCRKSNRLPWKAFVPELKANETMLQLQNQLTFPKVQSGVVLASKSKSFLDTHYRLSKFPVPLSEIFVENRMQLRYYNLESSKWTTEIAKNASFAHHVPVCLPSSSQFSFLLSMPQFRVDGSGPSSNEVLASQSKAPPGVNLQEFIAFQNIQSGRYRRWHETASRKNSGTRCPGQPLGYRFTGEKRNRPSGFQVQS